MRTQQLRVFVELLPPAYSQSFLRRIAVQQHLFAFHQISKRFRPFNAIGLVRCEVIRRGSESSVDDLRRQARCVQNVHNRGKGKTELGTRWLPSGDANRLPSVCVAQRAQFSAGRDGHDPRARFHSSVQRRQGLLGIARITAGHHQCRAASPRRNGVIVVGNDGHRACVRQHFRGDRSADSTSPHTQNQCICRRPAIEIYGAALGDSPRMLELCGKGLNQAAHLLHVVVILSTQR